MTVVVEFHVDLGEHADKEGARAFYEMDKWDSINYGHFEKVIVDEDIYEEGNE